MLSDAEKAHLVFQTIGWPIGSGTTVPTTAQLEEMTEYPFKSRVGLLFLEECKSKGVELGDTASQLHASLVARRNATDEVIVKLTKRLDEVATGEWVLFKSIKPFASTPNDTDWFPLDPGRHKSLVRHLTEGGGFKWLESAPRQTTLIEDRGVGLTDTTKKGGVYYIDCYVAPSTDYFIYLDPKRMRKNVTHTSVLGCSVPVLEPYAELAAVMFHNVFPEKRFSIESYYLIKSYLKEITAAHQTYNFVEFCREHKVEYAAWHNLALTNKIDRSEFGNTDAIIKDLLRELGPRQKLDETAHVPLPYDFSSSVFWMTFASKQRDVTSFISSLNQLVHMLNPVFFLDVVKIIWKRTRRGGVYEQN